MFHLITPDAWGNALANEDAWLSTLERVGGQEEDVASGPGIALFTIQPRGQQQQEQPVPEAMELEQEEEEEEEEETDLDFFADLPLGARGLDTSVPSTLKPPNQKTCDGYRFYSYSYNTCSTLDNQGRPVENTRRRYEDSSGRLKAVHHRQLGDQLVKSTWTRTNENEEGKHEQQIVPSTAKMEEFEKEWKEQTPFGQVHEQMSTATTTTTTKKEETFHDQLPPREIP